MELTKPEKRHARALMSQCVEKEFAIGLKKFDVILQNWKDKKQDNRESYHAIYEAVENYNKHIARRYDDVSNSILIYKIIELYREKLITKEDLNGFEQNTIQLIERYLME